MWRWERWQLTNRIFDTDSKIERVISSSCEFVAGPRHDIFVLVHFVIGIFLNAKSDETWTLSRTTTALKN
jgi:hypothetical protein